MVASINPTAWSYVGILTAALAYHALLSTGRRWRVGANASLVLLGALVSCGARTDAGPLLVVALGSITVLMWRRGLARPLRLLVLIPVGALAVWSFLSGSGAQATGGGIKVTTLSDGFLLLNNLLQYPTMFVGIYGYRFGLGWFEVTMPSVTVVGCIVVAGVMVFSGLQSLTPTKIVAWTLLASTMMALTLYMLGKDKIPLGGYVQPRYFLPLIPVLFLIAFTSADPRSAIVITRVKAIGLQMVLVLAHAAALFQVARRYLNGAGEFDSMRLTNPSRWWWPGAAAPLTWYVLGVVGFTILSSALWLVAGASRSSGGAHEARPQVED